MNGQDGSARKCWSRARGAMVVEMRSQVVTVGAKDGLENGMPSNMLPEAFLLP